MSHHPNSLWGIIKRAVKDIENLNNSDFGNESWNIFKRMEEEIYAWERKMNEHLRQPIVSEEVQIWNALTDVQRGLMNYSKSNYGTSILEHDREKLREARELEAQGYIKLERPEQYDARYWLCYATIKGRQLLKANGV